MLDATIRVMPYGDLSLAEDIVNMVVYNDGTGTEERGNYTAVVDCVTYRVENFDRSRGALALIGEVAKVVEDAKAD